jgi:hypothetical protein
MTDKLERLLDVLMAADEAIDDAIAALDARHVASDPVKPAQVCDDEAEREHD